MNKYIALVTISVPVKAKDADAAYDIAYTQCFNEEFLSAAGTSIYIENIEIKDA